MRELIRENLFEGKCSCSKQKPSGTETGNQCGFIIAKLINIDPNIGQYYLNIKKYKRRA